MRRSFLALAVCAWLAMPALAQGQAAAPAKPAAPELKPDAFEPNNDFDHATPVESGKAVQASIAPLKDVDFFCLDAPAPGFGYLDVEVRDTPDEIAPQCLVFGPDKKQIGRAQREPGEAVFMRFLIQAPGKYWISLRDGAVRYPDRMDDKASEKLMSVRLVFTPADRAFEPNDKIEDAKPIDLAKDVRATLFPNGDHDFYKVDVPAPGRGELRVAVTGAAECLRPGLWIYNAEKKEIARVNAGNPGDDITLTARVAAGGGYYVLVRNGDYNAGGRWRSWSSDASAQPYTLRVDFAPVEDAYEPNDSVAAARPVELGKEIKAAIFPAGDHDFYQIDIPSPGLGQLRIVLRDTPENIFPVMRIFDAGGKEIQVERRVVGGEVRVQRDLAAPGKLVILVQDGEHHNGRYWEGWNDSWSKQPYTLTATFTPVADAYEPNPNHDTAKAIEVGKEIEATIFPAGDHDFYKFSLPAKARGALRVKVWGANDKIVPMVRLYNAAKQEIQTFKRDRDQPVTLWRDMADGGDFFILVQDAEFFNGRNWEGWNDSSSVEPYHLKIEFDAAAGTAGEPNDGGADAAEAIKLGEPREGTLFPAGDVDYYKFEVGENDKGTYRVELEGMPALLRTHVGVYGPNREAILNYTRQQERQMLHFNAGAPGVYYVSVRFQDTSWRGRWVGWQHFSRMTPYKLTVSKAPAPNGDEDAGGGSPAESKPLTLGKMAKGKLDKDGFSGWYRVNLDKPSRLEFECLSDGDVDAQILAYVYAAADAGRLGRKKVLYLRGPRGDFGLDGKLGDVELTRVEHNAADARTVLLNAERLKEFDAILVDNLHDPAHFDLLSQRAQENITRFVENGGRFIVLAPVCNLTLFGVELAEPGAWREDVSVDLFSGCALLKGVRKGRTRWWNWTESVGYFVKWREAGFEALYGDASDPETRALTVAKAMGKGWVVLDTQTIGHVSNFPEAHWKLRAYLGLPVPLEVVAINGQGTPD
ncbi:MAG TPA: hypothetical protein P5137_12985, partial [Candidatus Brocadiia bacterium]|nr:hypothetical protein [Candidatus Brocadiia bacterium]